MAIQRIRVEDLTPGERKGLQDQGRPVPDTGFVDIAPIAPPAMVDARAPDRARATAALKSVAPPPAPQATGPAPVLASPEDTPVTKTPQELAQDRIKEAEERKDKVCAHCGMPPDQDPGKVNAEEMKEFLRSVVGGEVYTQTFSLFGGAVSATLRTRTEQEDEAVRVALRYLVRSGQIENEQELIQRARRIHLAVGISRLVLGSNVVPYAPLPETLPANKLHEGEAVLQEVSARLSRIPSQLLEALYACQGSFVAAVSVMTRKARDPGFWQGSETTL